MRSILFVLGFLLILTGGYAQDSLSHPKDSITAPWYVERFRIAAGGFVPVISTAVQVGIKGGYEGTYIDFEKDLGMNSSEFTIFAGAQWRISRRSRLNFCYYDVRRSSTRKLDRDITFKGDTFHVNSVISSFFNTGIYQISYGYSILAKPRYEVGVLIGTHLVGAKTGIEMNGTTVGNTGHDFGFTAPLPDLGLWGGYAISKRLAVNLEVDYLSLTIDDTQGSIFAYNLLFMYRLVGKLDLSLGFSGLNFTVNKEKEGFQGYLKWGYNGPALGVSFSFGKTSWKH